MAISTALTKKQWMQSLRSDAWISVDSSPDLVKKVAAAVAGLAAKAQQEVKPTLTVIPGLQTVNPVRLAPIQILHALAKITTPKITGCATGGLACRPFHQQTSNRNLDSRLGDMTGEKQRKLFQARTQELDRVDCLSCERSFATRRYIKQTVHR